MRSRHFLLLSLPGALLLPGATPAQGTFHGRRGELTARVPAIDATAIIDGMLDEPAWQVAARLTGFSSYLPFDGRPAQDSTEILVWYSATAVYFGIRAFEFDGPVHATLAARDRIDSDDYVQLLIDPFNDRRRAFVFGVNPLGVQADGTRTDGAGGTPQTRGQTFGGNPPANIDLSTDFLYDSKGHVTTDGYEVEVRIPLTSIRFQGTDPQDWSFQVLRYVQHSGYQQTWTPARRGAASLLVQSGTLAGFRGLRRDPVVELNPEFTAVRSGDKVSDAWRTTTDPALGGNLRWRLVPNLTVNATMRPDFSQVEADAAQIPGDSRFALFFPEKRPFFVDGIEQFETPDNLIYTRRIVQPDAALKLSGKVGRTTLAMLSAVDSRDASDSGDHPVFNLLRLRRDVSSASSMGLAYTDRIDGSTYNRVAAADTRILFAREYTFNGSVATSVTRDAGGTHTAPLWSLSSNRTGLHYGYLLSFSGIAPDFAAAAGFVPRTDFVKASAYNRFSFYGRPGSFLESWLIRQGLDELWLYDKFRRGNSVQETKFQLENVLNLRGGWVVSLTPVTESFLFDPRRYAPYAVVNGPADTTMFTPSPRTAAAYGLVRVNTPQYRLFSGRFSSFIGRDVDFFETAPSHRTDLTADIDFRPSDQLRLTTSYLYSTITRWRDNTVLSRANVPRLKVEYQLSRPLFLRFVGQYDSRTRDALRDPATGRALLVNGALAAAQVTRDLRVDWLVSYLPSPGTVVFAGYGASLTEPEAFRFRDLERVRDGFFLKVSYVFRP